MATDIKQTGYQTYRDLQTQNEARFNPETASAEDWYKHLRQRSYNSYANQPTEYVGLQAAQAGFGDSQYDEGLVSTSQLSDINDIRYQNQPWYDTLANGVGKMLGTAGTTFVSSLVGLPAGIATAIGEGRWSGLWDNDVTNALGDVDKWLEENMTNYKSTEQQNAPWYSLTNLGSMNFWADDVIKNAGFTLGAASSMAVGSGSLGLLAKSLGFVNDVHKGVGMGGKVASALFSATGEGMIEARNGVEERNKLKFQELEDALAPEKQALDEEFNLINAQYSLDGDYNAYKQRMDDYAIKRDALSQKMEYGRQEIIDSGREMGNKILAGNQVLLTAGNIIQFGKLMNKSFNNARHAAEVTSKTSKPFLAGAERVSSNIADGYKTTGKGIGRLHAATKGIFTEGSEEMNQQWIQNTAGYTEERKGINDYWKAKYDPEAYKDTSRGLYTLGQAINQGFKDSWGDINQWEQFVIGGLTGMAGSYAPTKLFNQDKTKSRWDPRRYGEWSGGAINEVRDFNKEFNQYQENIDDLNKVLAQEDFGERTRNLIAHTYLESSKEKALQENDKKAWKDEDDKQAIHDIQAFLRAGKLDDLRAIYDEMGKDMSDDEIEDIVKRSTKEVTAEEDKRNYDREIDAQIGQHQQRIADINSRIDDYTDALEAFSDGAERSSYLTTITPRIAELREEVRKETDAIQNLNQQKDAYTGQKRFEGAYLDDKGNRTKSNDEIREEIKHNTEELNRKLDGYLDSINFVNQRTNGQLTKDQEDNLAYLHNMGKESLNRTDKIMTNVRQSLPTKFLLKTTKTPEELAKENGSSDLTFTKDENTKEGYVEVDTSLMNDHSFADFFLRNVLWGGNIRPEFGETADERAAREEEEKGLNEEEKRKRRTAKWKKALEDAQNDAKEQNNTNVDLMVQNFLDNYRKNNRSNQAEAFDALNEMLGDIADASSLMQQAGEYYRTLDDYLKHPEKIDQDKEKEEKKADKKNAEEDAKNKFAGKTAKEIKNNVDAGDIDFSDLDAVLKGNPDIEIDSDTVQAVQEAKNILDKQQSMEGFLNGVDNPTAVADAKQMMQWLGNSVETAEGITVDALNDFDADNLISDEEAAFMYQRGYNDEMIHEQAEARKQQAINALSAGMTAWQADQDARSRIPSEEKTGTFDLGDTGHDATTQSPSNQGKDAVTPASPEAEVSEEPASVTPGESEAAIKEAMQSQQVLQTDNGGTWRNNTRRYGYHSTTTPYHEIVSDKNSLRYKRSKAIYDFLSIPDAAGLSAFDHVENASEDRIRRNDPIRFRVKSLAQEIFGKPFSELTEQEKKDSIVIFMVDDKNHVLGDLPYPALEISMINGKPTKDVKLLDGLYIRVTDAFIKRNEKDGTTDIMVDGPEGLNMKFKNGKPLVGQVFEVNMGNIPYSNERKSLNTINTDPQTGAIKPFELAIKVIDGQINTGHKKKVDAKGFGKVGQCYILIPDASGKKIAVPFATPLFNAAEMRTTELYKFLTEALTELEKYSDVEAAKAGKNKEERNKAIDTLCALLQIESPFLDIQKDRVILRYNNIGEENKQRVEVAKGDDWKDRLLDSLNGTPIQVSLRHINGNISVGRKAGNYNEVIGEIAHTNLPENTTHTVGSWFTIRNLSEEGPQQTKQVKYPEGVTRTYTISGGRTISITSGNVWSATNKSIESLIKERLKGLNLPSEDLNSIISEIGAIPANADSNQIQGTIDKAFAVNKDAETWLLNNRGFRGQVSVAVKGLKDKLPMGEIEKRAKALGISSAKTQYAWNAIPEESKRAIMEGKRVAVTFNGTTKEISVNSVQETTKVLQEWNVAMKRNPNGMTTEVLNRRVDDAERRKADIQKEKRWLQKNLPMFNTEERLHLIQGLLEIPGEESWAWGRFEKGVITLSDRAAGGTLYHEAFHAVTQTLLSDEELDNLYEAAVKHYNEKDVALVEELLAEDFRRYVQRGETPIVGPILKVFRRLLNAIRNINGYKAPIHQLFYRINNGEFSDSTSREARVGNAFYSRYINRVSPRLAYSNHPLVKDVIKDFSTKSVVSDDPTKVGNNWSKFKEYWKKKDIIVEGHYCKHFIDKRGWVIDDIRINLNGAELTIGELQGLEERQKRRAEEYAAKQAMKGRMSVQQWDRLTMSEKMSLEEYQMSREIWDNMTVGEQEQWLNCHI